MQSRVERKEGTYCCLLDALRVYLRSLQTDCFAEPVLSVTMIFRVAVGVVDDEKNGGSSQSCARRLHSRSFRASGPRAKLDLFRLSFRGVPIASPTLVPRFGGQSYRNLITAYLDLYELMHINNAILHTIRIFQSNTLTLNPSDYIYPSNRPTIQ